MKIGGQWRREGLRLERIFAQVDGQSRTETPMTNLVHFAFWPTQFSDIRFETFFFSINKEKKKKLQNNVSYHKSFLASA